MATADSCHSSAKHIVYGVLMWLGMVGNLCWDCVVLVVGTRGGMFETRRRRLLEWGLVWLFPKAMASALLTAWGIAMVIAFTACGGGHANLVNAEAVMQALVWTHMLLTMYRWGVLLLTFNTFPDFEDPKTWEKRCRCCTSCLCLGGSRLRYTLYENSPDVLRRLAKIMSKTFGYVDMTPSDVITSMWVAAKMQRWERRRAMAAQLGISPEDLNLPATSATPWAGAESSHDVEVGQPSAFHTPIITPLGSKGIATSAEPALERAISQREAEDPGLLAGSTGNHQCTDRTQPVSGRASGGVPGSSDKGCGASGGGARSVDPGSGTRGAGGSGGGANRSRGAGDDRAALRGARVEPGGPCEGGLAPVQESGDAWLGEGTGAGQEGAGAGKEAAPAAAATGPSGMANGGGSSSAELPAAAAAAGSNGIANGGGSRSSADLTVAGTTGPLPCDGSAASGGRHAGSSIAQRLAEAEGLRLVAKARAQGKAAAMLTPVTTVLGPAGRLDSQAGSQEVGYEEVGLSDLSLATHFMKFAFAAYGWKLYTVATYGVVGSPLALCLPQYGRHRLKKHLLDGLEMQRKEREGGRQAGDGQQQKLQVTLVAGKTATPQSAAAASAGAAGAVGTANESTGGVPDRGQTAAAAAGGVAAGAGVAAAAEEEGIAGGRGTGGGAAAAAAGRVAAAEEEDDNAGGRRSGGGAAAAAGAGTACSSGDGTGELGGGEPGAAAAAAAAVGTVEDRAAEVEEWAGATSAAPGQYADRPHQQQQQQRAPPLAKGQSISSPAVMHRQVATAPGPATAASSGGGGPEAVSSSSSAPANGLDTSPGPAPTSSPQPTPTTHAPSHMQPHMHTSASSPDLGPTHHTRATAASTTPTHPTASSENGGTSGSSTGTTPSAPKGISQAPSKARSGFRIPRPKANFATGWLSGGELGWAYPIAPEKQMSLNAILLSTGLAVQDLCFVRYDGERPLVMPYFIALDHAQHSVVLSIRGTMTVEDCLTDVLYEPASLEEWLMPVQLDPQTGKWVPPKLTLIDRYAKFAAHSGMLEMAQAMLQDISEQDVLRKVVTHVRKQDDWDLVVTGHSLGAGVASLVGLYLRQPHPATRVWAFCPPGGTMSPAAAELTKEFVISVAVGKDIVPRLNARSFDTMHVQMVEAAARCRVGKARIIAGVLSRKRWQERDLVYAEDHMPQEAAQALRQYREKKLERSPDEAEVEDCCASFTAPGRMIFLRPFPVTDGLRGKEKMRMRFKPVWIEPHTLVDEGILFSRRMWSDHFPWYVLAVLRALAQAGVEHQDSAEVAVADSAADGDTEGRQRVADRVASLVKSPARAPPPQRKRRGLGSQARSQMTNLNSRLRNMVGRGSPRTHQPDGSRRNSHSTLSADSSAPVSLPPQVQPPFSRSADSGSK